MGEGADCQGEQGTEKDSIGEEGSHEDPGLTGRLGSRPGKEEPSTQSIAPTCLPSGLGTHVCRTKWEEN